MSSRLPYTLFLGFLWFPIACSENGEPSVSPSAESGKSDPDLVTNTIRFETASEDGLFGFVLFRGDSETGDFLKVNESPVGAGGYTDIPRQYEIFDDNAIPGRTYYYFIQSIGYDNVRKKFSPVFPYKTPAS